MKETSSKNAEYLTPKQAASRLMISPVTLRHWALAGKLAFVTTPGGHRRYAESEVERFATQNKQTPVSPAPNVLEVPDDGGQRILIVDDDVQLSGFLVELLKGLPELVETEVAHDGFEAGQKMLSFRPHTILLDLMMPGLKGFEVCRRIKDSVITRDTRVVMMTGYNTPENIQQAIAAGAEACLAKPIDKVQLFKAIVLGAGNTIVAHG